MAASQDVFCAMFKEASRQHEQGGIPCPRYTTLLCARITRFTAVQAPSLSTLWCCVYFVLQAGTATSSPPPSSHTRLLTTPTPVRCFRIHSRKPPFLFRCCRFHCPVEFTGLLSWALSRGLKVFRATIIMARGPYEHTRWSSDAGFVVAPSIAGY